jgi:hypothetical protein
MVIHIARYTISLRGNRCLSDKSLLEDMALLGPLGYHMMIVAHTAMRLKGAEITNKVGNPGGRFSA